MNFPLGVILLGFIFISMVTWNYFDNYPWFILNCPWFVPNPCESGACSFDMKLPGSRWLISRIGCMVSSWYLTNTLIIMYICNGVKKHIKLEGIIWHGMYIVESLTMVFTHVFTVSPHFQNCSLFYTKRFCMTCTKANIQEFPIEIQQASLLSLLCVYYPVIFKSLIKGYELYHRIRMTTLDQWRHQHKNGMVERHIF